MECILLLILGASIFTFSIKRFFLIVAMEYYANTFKLVLIPILQWIFSNCFESIVPSVWSSSLYVLGEFYFFPFREGAQIRKILNCYFFFDHLWIKAFLIALTGSVWRASMFENPIYLVRYVPSNRNERKSPRDLDTPTSLWWKK